MKGKAAGIALLLLAAAAAMLAAAILLRQQKTGPQHVFINETADHRFDESIQASILAAYARTRVQNAVVISDRFAEEELERATADLFHKLALGRGSGGRAILYLFSPARHALKIEVGYALEGVMPDSKVRFLESAAKTFTFADRYQDFWAELINTINLEIQGQGASEAFDFSRFKFLSGGAGVLARQYRATPEQLALELRSLPEGAQGDFAAGAEPRATLERYLASLGAGLGGAELPLLAPESSLFRRFTPLTTYQLYRNSGMYTRAGLDRLIVAGGLAFAFFRPGHPVLPIVLQRGKDALWRVHEPLSWALFHRFEDSRRVFLKFPIETESRELKDYLAKNLGRPLYRAKALSLAEWPGFQDPVRYFYFHLFWLERVEAALENPGLAQEESLPWIALDTSLNLGRMTEYLQRMERLAKLRPKDAELTRELAFYRETLKFDGPVWVKRLP